MPTLYGSWEGPARMRLEYTRSYNSDHTEARYDGDVYIEFNTSVTDTTNTWAVTSPQFSNKSGSNLSISIPSGGGKKKVTGFDFWHGDDGEIYAEVDNIEYVGQRVEHNFTLPAGDLAPFWNHTNYSATSVTSSSFSTTGVSASANGGTLNNTQIHYNTAPSTSGGWYYDQGFYGNISVGGLQRATTYYFRLRVHNSTYGWGAWGPWKSVTTHTTIPSPATTGFTFTNITQTSAEIIGEAVSDNGGAGLTNWSTYINTSPVLSGGTQLFSGNGSNAPNPTNLIPGTLYYVAIIPANVNGWASAWSAFKTFTTLPGVSVNVADEWKNAQPWVNVGGIWKPAVRYVNVDGVWKQ